MRTLRVVLNVLVFLIAVSGSIWVGWIYASPNPRPEKMAPLQVTPDVSVFRHVEPDYSEALKQSNEIPGFGGGLPSVPGLPGGLNGATVVDGFPTISKEAIEKAPGYSGKAAEPEIEIPSLNIGESSGATP